MALAFFLSLFRNGKFVESRGCHPSPPQPPVLLPPAVASVGRSGISFSRVYGGAFQKSFPTPLVNARSQYRG
jgi:hypothetical protein